MNPSRYVGQKEEQFRLFNEIKLALDGMGDSADGLMVGEKDDIVSWWRGAAGEIVMRYSCRNWGYSFYLMSALCDDNADGSPISKGLLDMIEKEKDTFESEYLWANMPVFFMLAFGSILDTPVSSSSPYRIVWSEMFCPRCFVRVVFLVQIVLCFLSEMCSSHVTFCFFR